RGRQRPAPLRPHSRADSREAWQPLPHSQSLSATLARNATPTHTRTHPVAAPGGSVRRRFTNGLPSATRRSGRVKSAQLGLVLEHAYVIPDLPPGEIEREFATNDQTLAGVGMTVKCGLGAQNWQACNG